MHYERTVRERLTRPGRMTQRVCTLYRRTMNIQSGNEWPGMGAGCGECQYVHYEQIGSPPACSVAVRKPGAVGRSTGRSRPPGGAPGPSLSGSSASASSQV